MWNAFSDCRLRRERAWLIGIALSSRAHPLAGDNARRLLDSLEAELRRRQAIARKRHASPTTAPDRTGSHQRRL